jgi:hypothetical protein
MLVWPVVAALGFLLLNGLVIALGASSTARYEFGRNRVREAAREAVGVAQGAGGPVSGPPPGGADGSAPEPADREEQLALGLAAHPAGTAAGWWLVTEDDDLADPLDDAGTGRALAGPFTDRVEAEWAALSGDLRATAVYGVRRPGEGIVRRPSPQERDWLGELGEHLGRLGTDWDEIGESDPLTTLAVEVTAALVDAGLALHDCAGGNAVGGVCLTPASGFSGILVSWHQHDRVSLQQVRGAGVDTAVQRTMNSAVAEVLLHQGFAVESLASAGCHLVTIGGP